MKHEYEYRLIRGDWSTNWRMAWTDDSGIATIEFENCATRAEVRHYVRDAGPAVAKEEK